MFLVAEVNYLFNYSFINILAVKAFFYELLLHTSKKIIKIYVRLTT